MTTQDVEHASQISHPTDWNALSSIRGRREASRRLEPLIGGHRDPMDLHEPILEPGPSACTHRCKTLELADLRRYAEQYGCCPCLVVAS